MNHSVGITLREMVEKNQHEINAYYLKKIVEFRQKLDLLNTMSNGQADANEIKAIKNDFLNAVDFREDSMGKELDSELDLIKICDRQNKILEKIKLQKSIEECQNKMYHCIWVNGMKKNHHEIQKYQNEINFLTTKLKKMEAT